MTQKNVVEMEEIVLAGHRVGSTSSFTMALAVPLWRTSYLSITEQTAFPHMI